MQGPDHHNHHNDCGKVEDRPQPHKRPQRPTVTSPGWILQRRSVGWNLGENDGGALRIGQTWLTWKDVKDEVETDVLS